MPSHPARLRRPEREDHQSPTGWLGHKQSAIGDGHSDRPPWQVSNCELAAVGVRDPDLALGRVRGGDGSVRDYGDA